MKYTIGFVAGSIVAAVVIKKILTRSAESYRDYLIDAATKPVRQTSEENTSPIYLPRAYRRHPSK